MLMLWWCNFIVKKKKKKAMLMGFLCPQLASINSMNICFKTKIIWKPYNHFSLTSYFLLNNAMKK